MADAAQANAYYYVNPLAMPALDLWPGALARIADLGFDAILIAPPFAAGRDGTLFLSSDHDKLHACIGGGDATEWLASICEMARGAGLQALLDLRTALVDDDAAVLREHPEWRHAGAEADQMHDPRRLSDPGARLRDPAPEALIEWWSRRVIRWTDTGIAGFRCLDAGLGCRFWKPLIDAARADRSSIQFIAWTPGLSPAEVNDLKSAGFDFTVSSLPWWNFEDAWWSEECARLALVAPVLAMPEAPFAPRLASRHTDGAERAAARALRFAALTGAAWLMPMGFEYGDLNRMGHGPGQARAFEALRQSPRIDLLEVIRDANRERRLQRGAASSGPPIVISGPRAPVTQVLRQHDDGRRMLVLVNKSLHRGAAATAGQIAEALPTAGSMQGHVRLELQPAEVRSLLIGESHPIRSSPDLGDAGVRAFAQSPRIAIEAVTPTVDGGRFTVKRIVGHPVTVSADVFTDGATKLAVRLRWRAADETDWREVPMRHMGNDVYTAEFVPERVGRYAYTICAWVDAYGAFLDEIRPSMAPASTSRWNGARA